MICQNPLAFWLSLWRMKCIFGLTEWEPARAVQRLLKTSVLVNVAGRHFQAKQL